MLNHLYRLIVSWRGGRDGARFPEPRPVAFFPRTFFPFSAGHKEIVRAIHGMGLEVYLAIDEFSWSKRTIPKLLRRKMAAISVADLWDVYLFPDNMPINIASPEDLAALAGKFPGRELYLAAGGDVIFGASAYQTEAPGSARYYNHVIFRRATDQTAGEKLAPDSPWGSGSLSPLPAWCETVSSTQIREYVDKNLDISVLVDPIVQSYIYANGLYLRSPQFKNVLAPGDLYFERAREAGSLCLPCSGLPWTGTGAAGASSSRPAPPRSPWAGSAAHTVTSSQLLQTLGSQDAAAYVRRHTSGRIMMVDSVVSLSPQTEGARRQLVNEPWPGASKPTTPTPCAAAPAGTACTRTCCGWAPPLLGVGGPPPPPASRTSCLWICAHPWCSFRTSSSGSKSHCAATAWYGETVERTRPSSGGPSPPSSPGRLPAVALTPKP